MNKPELISVIITSYNWSKALKAVLMALNHQVDNHFEVLIADDGSQPEELNIIRETLLRCSFSSQIVWQEDCGFRAAKARNRSVMLAKGNYLIFLDGDCIPRKDFIARHRQLAEPGFWVPGNRILLSNHFTQKILADESTVYDQSYRYWWLQRFRGNVNRCLPLFYWPFSFGRKKFPTAWKGAKTCNLGVWKQDFFYVNGFDERYQGWGYEDSDLIVRLIRLGIYRKSGKFALPVFHCWHPEQKRDQEANNLARLHAMIANSEQRALVGLDQYE